MTETETAPQGTTKSEYFWALIRQKLEDQPNKLILVTVYNHPTLAYRAKRDINSGLNPIFPEVGLWRAEVVRDPTSGFIGPRSGKITYKHEVYIIYTPKDKQ